MKGGGSRRWRLPAPRVMGFMEPPSARFSSQSDREIARMVGCSPSTVAPIRTDMEERGELSRLDSRMGNLSQPATKPPQTNGAGGPPVEGRGEISHVENRIERI
jgi:hypothetical protein